MNQGHYVSRNARYWANRPAVIFKDQVLTFKQLDERSNRLANALINQGQQKGDRVGIFTWNCPEMIELECALYKAGLVKVALNARLSAQEAIDTLNNAQPTILLTDAGHAETVANILPQLETVQKVIITGPSPINGWSSYEKFITPGADRNPLISVTADDLAVLHFTSGSTGKLKAAMQTVGNRLASLRKVIIGRMRAGPNDMLALSGPITHASGMFIQPFLFQGGTILLHDRFEPDQFLHSIEKHRATFTFMVPTMVNMLTVHPDLHRYDLSSLRQVSYGGAPMAPARLKEAWKNIGPIFTQGYGAGETTGGLTVLSIDDHAQAIAQGTDRLLSCGRHFAEGQIGILDDEGNELGTNELGELSFKGPDIFAGYWREPELTAEVLQDDGWLRTGDIARMDEDGYIFIVDRKKDMIISGGFNIYPTEVEQALYQHPAIYETCVVGVPDDAWGEAVKAVVVVKPGYEVSPEELSAHCRTHLADYKRPRSVEFVTELPKNANGKLARKVVRDQYWKDLERKVS